MPQYGPFVEVFCETYVHHAVLNGIVAAVIIFAAILVLAAFAWAYWMVHKKGS